MDWKVHAAVDRRKETVHYSITRNPETGLSSPVWRSIKTAAITVYKAKLLNRTMNRFIKIQQ